MNRFLSSVILAAALVGGISPLYGQATPSENRIVIQPLFEYPVAPESIPGLTDKSNWLLEHFWDSFDFKSNKAVDQNALNHAFMVYTGPMRLGDRDVAIVQTDKLIDKLAKNPTYLVQFTKAAEENLYGPRAEVLIDEIYVKFLQALVKNKKIPEARRARYQRQLTQLSNTLKGAVPPSFNFTTPTGVSETFRPGWLTVIEFGDPSCADCRYAKLKMNTDLKFSELVEKGKVNVLFIIPDPDEEWEKELEGFPPLWHSGASDTVSDIYDIRSTPTLYVIGTDGKILLKTGRVDEAINMAKQAAAISKTN